MSNLALNQSDSPFDAIRHQDERGNEFWSARELMPVLGYNRWDRVPDIVERASVSCRNSGNSVSAHFSEETRKSNGRPQQDFRLSRLACYLVAMNGDPRKHEIAGAQAYFAIKTREAETVIPQLPKIGTREDWVKRELLEKEIQLIHAQTQKIILEKVVKDKEYPQAAIYPTPAEIIDASATITRTELCIRYGILQWNTEPDYWRLEYMLEYVGALPAYNERKELWKTVARIKERPCNGKEIEWDYGKEFRREYLPMLDELMLSIPNRGFDLLPAWYQEKLEKKEKRDKFYDN